MIRERIFWDASGLISSGLVEKAGRLLALKTRAGRSHAAHLARAHCILVMTLSIFGLSLLEAVVTLRWPDCPKIVTLCSRTFPNPTYISSRRNVLRRFAPEAPPDAMFYTPLAIYLSQRSWHLKLQKSAPRLRDPPCILDGEITLIIHQLLRSGGSRS